jgi:hypothetical protein
MVHHFAVRHCCERGSGIKYVADFHDLALAEPPRLELVIDNDLVTSQSQSIRNMAAEKPAPAGN